MPQRKLSNPLQHVDKRKHQKSPKSGRISGFFTPSQCQCVKKKDLASTNPKNTKRKNLDFSRLFTGAPRVIRTHNRKTTEIDRGIHSVSRSLTDSLSAANSNSSRSQPEQGKPKQNRPAMETKSRRNRRTDRLKGHQYAKRTVGITYFFHKII